MEINGIGESFLVAKPSATNFDHLYLAIESFCRTVADLENNCIQNPPKMRFNCPGHFLDWTKTATYSPG